MTNAKRVLILLFILSVVCSCAEEKKMTVKRVERFNYELHWYFYSYITNYSSGHVDLIAPNGDVELIFKAQLITDVSFKSSDTIEIKCIDCDVRKLKKEINGFTVVVNKNGKHENLLDNRMQRQLNNK